jgi:hypothetical protein
VSSGTSHAAQDAAAINSKVEKSPAHPVKAGRAPGKKRVRRSAAATPVEYAEAFTITQFIRAHAICKQTLYNLWAAGRGPQYFLIGKHRRITREAARAWRESSKP